MANLYKKNFNVADSIFIYIYLLLINGRNTAFRRPHRNLREKKVPFINIVENSFMEKRVQRWRSAASSSLLLWLLG